MNTWYKNSRFLRRPDHLQNIDQAGLEHLDTSVYSADYVLWKMLQKGQLHGFKFERQQRILDTIVSFYCREARLAVDLEHVEHKIRQKEEQESDLLLQKLGIKVLRFHRDAILERPHSVRNSILEELAEIKREKQLK